MTKKAKGKPGKPPRFQIESVTETDRSIEVMFNGVRMTFDGISEPQESNFSGTVSHRFTAGLEIPDTKEVQDLIKKIRAFFKAYDAKGWSSKVALEHFDAKKFQPSKYTEGAVTLFPSAPAEQTEDGDFIAKGRLYVNPSHNAFYSGCYVDVKVAFVANLRGTIVVKDYLNAIRFAGDGEEITGASDPWGDSKSREVVSSKK